MQRAAARCGSEGPAHSVAREHLAGTAAVQLASQATGQTGPGWTQLFDGKSLDGWDQTGEANWRIEDGAIVADKGKGGHLVTKDSYKNHMIYAEFWSDEDANSGIATYGYGTTSLLVHILKQCGDDLTRANIMKQATNITGFTSDLALPGMNTSTTPDDWRINKQFQMMRFDGERWVLFGPVISGAASG